jgi:hypothetical protein
MKASSIIRKLLILALSIVVVVFGTEFVLRYLGYKPNPFAVNSAITGDTKYTFARPDPEIGWVNKAGVALSAEEGNREMTILEDGQRMNVPSAKETTGGNVMVVGCSITMGYGVKDEETFSSLLQRRYPNVVFENYGCGGYGTLQSYMVLKRRMTSKEGGRAPGLVIYGYIPAHKERNVVTEQWAFALTDSRGRTLTPPHALFDGQGNLVMYPLSVVAPWPLEGKSALVTLIHRKIRTVESAQHSKQRDPVTLRIVSDMANYVKKQGGRLVVVVLHPSIDVRGDGTIREDTFPESMRQRGIEYVVCKHPQWDSNFVKYVNSGGHNNALLINGNGHPNKDLHRYWAQCISRYIDNSGVIEQVSR